MKSKTNMITRGLGVILALLMVLVPGTIVLADPPVGTAPTIDGTINLTGEGWNSTFYPNGTLLVFDATNDSAWGSNNELYNVYINWDATYLYLAVDYRINNNGMIVYLDFGTTAGIKEFKSTNGYLGAWPRDVSFATNGIDAFWAAWNGANGNVYKANGSNNSTDITGAQNFAVTGDHSGNKHSEIRIRWADLGFSAPLYPTGGGAAISEIYIFAALVGGDNFGAGDTSNGNSTNTRDIALSNMAKAGVGQNAITLSSFNATSALPLAGVVLLGGLGGLALWRRRK